MLPSVRMGMEQVVKHANDSKTYFRILLLHTPLNTGRMFNKTPLRRVCKTLSHTTAEGRE